MRPNHALQRTQRDHAVRFKVSRSGRSMLSAHLPQRSRQGDSPRSVGVIQGDALFVGIVFTSATPMSLELSLRRSKRSADTLYFAPESCSVFYLPVQTGANHATGLTGSAPGASPPPAFHTLTKTYLLVES